MQPKAIWKLLWEHMVVKATCLSAGREHDKCLPVEPPHCPWPDPTHEVGVNTAGLLPGPAHNLPCPDHETQAISKLMLGQNLFFFSPFNKYFLSTYYNNNVKTTIYWALTMFQTLFQALSYMTSFNLQSTELRIISSSI